MFAEPRKRCLRQKSNSFILVVSKGRLYASNVLLFNQERLPLKDSNLWNTESGLWGLVFACARGAAGLAAAGVALHSPIHRQISCYGRVPGGGLAAVGLGRLWLGFVVPGVCVDSGVRVPDSEF